MIVVLLVVALGGITACVRGGPGDQGWHMMDWHYMMGGGGLIMWILLIIVIAVVVYLFVQRGGSNSLNPRRETPLDVLKDRYARGEISKEEYENMKRDLE
ncbi:SHOCT domain-containing protein [candidate division KSB3 bacterium]|uniref:SHOCT domain-containing protein n=1 Tax=candidate division KSB3 bacterium TaxID=2044937 RepID=A0A9D5Q5N6_9BACT|nr:SHOCT domain-containing protein [candidate division KSB3 bacterium]MBD3324061.1 SHOCT domain-containing protein [candidate division KSB3 bacterium]